MHALILYLSLFKELNWNNSSTLDFGRFTSFLLLILFCSLRVCHVYNMATGSGEDIRGFVKEAVKENNDKLLANINSMIFYELNWNNFAKYVSQSEILGPIEQITSQSKNDIKRMQQILWYLRSVLQTYKTVKSNAVSISFKNDINTLYLCKIILYN